jgi:hypothetical protein
MTTLREQEIQALLEALDDEHHSWATYDQVISDFGEVLPFANIREAEARHIDALRTLFSRYGVPIPENPWPGKIPSCSSLHAACEAGVKAETANAEMYERLMAATDRPDILAVLGNLRAASKRGPSSRCSESIPYGASRRGGTVTPRGDSTASPGRAGAPGTSCSSR